MEIGKTYEIYGVYLGVAGAMVDHPTIMMTRLITDGTIVVDDLELYTEYEGYSLAKSQERQNIEKITTNLDNENEVEIYRSGVYKIGED